MSTKISDFHFYRAKPSHNYSNIEIVPTILKLKKNWNSKKIENSNFWNFGLKDR